jgi:hypothetical protein
MSVFNGVGVEITLPDSECFLKAKETLTRIGVSSERTKTLYQSCHILHKRGCYAIVHFKELFALDGKPSSFDAEDIERRDMIASLLADWGLVKIIDTSTLKSTANSIRLIKIVPFKDKGQYTLTAKYQIGKQGKRS